jgi:hypothetical protein
MKTRLNIKTILFVLLAGFWLSACDTDGEESMSWKPGTTLHIIGSTEQEAGATAQSYYVDGFTVKENYTWQLNGTPLTPTRGGEYVSIDFPNAGTYTITVTNGVNQGNLVITAE